MNFNPFDLLDDDNEDNEEVIEKPRNYHNDDIISNKYKTKTVSNKILTSDKFVSNKISTSDKFVSNKISTSDRFVSNKISTSDRFVSNKISTSDKFVSNKNISNNDRFLKKNETNENSFIEVKNTSRYKKEENTIIIKNFEDDNILYSLPFNYKMYVLHVLEKGWNDILNFNNILILTKWKDISEVINSLIFKKDKMIDFNLSFMKNNISPIWEDNENRYGSRTNIQIYDIDESLELLKIFLINIVNKTLLNQNINNKFLVNGIAFYPKKDKDNISYQIIQIWYNLDITKSFKIFNENIENLLKKKNYSVRTRLHAPQF
jgi:hypothetical protein